MPQREHALNLDRHSLEDAHFMPPGWGILHLDLWSVFEMMKPFPSEDFACTPDTNAIRK